MVIFGISAFFTQKTRIIYIFNISFTKSRKDPHKFKISKNNGHIRNLRIFLPQKLVSFVFCIVLSLNPGKTQQKLKIPRKTSQIRILRVFLPRSHISHVFLTYLSLISSKKLTRPHKFKIPWQTSQIRIHRVRFGGSQSPNIDISTKSEFYVN